MAGLPPLYAPRPVSTDPDAIEPEGDAPEPSPCQACRGLGTVVSNLGGEPSTVTCPWCEGTTMFLPEHNAQAHWGDNPPRGATAAPAADAPA